jgi:YD repeat-containing protein
MKRALKTLATAILVLVPLSLLILDVPWDALRFLFATTVYQEQLLIPEDTQVCVTSSCCEDDTLSESRNDVSCPSTSAHPIQYFNGTILYQIPGLYFPGPGFGWGHRPSYNNNLPGGNANLRNGWNWFTGMPRLGKISDNELRYFTRAHRSTKYLGGSGNPYTGQHGSDAIIEHYPSPDKVMVLRLPSGAYISFHDFDSSHGEKAGQVAAMSDAYGNVLTPEYDSSNRLFRVTDTGGRVWLYEYYDSGPNTGRMERVTANEGAQAVGRMEFYYFDGSSAYASGSGTIGDLMRVVLYTQDETGLVGRTVAMFRYYTGAWSSFNRGTDHKLKYIVGAQGFKDLATIGSPLLASDTTVQAHADYYFEYQNQSSFVTLERARAAGCSCGGSTNGQGVFQYEYEPGDEPAGEWGVSVYRVLDGWKARVRLVAV